MLPTGSVSEFIIGVGGDPEGTPRNVQITHKSAPGRRQHMRTATITLRGADFAKKMSEMRVWLDRHSFEPTRFTYKQDREIIVLSVDFKENHQAEAFQSRFDGQQREMASSHRSVQKQLNRAGAIASLGEAETRGT